MGSCPLALPRGAAVHRCVSAAVFDGASTIVLKIRSHDAYTASACLPLQMPGGPVARAAHRSTPEGSAMESAASQGQELRIEMAGLTISSPLADQGAGGEGGEAAGQGVDSVPGTSC